MFLDSEKPKEFFCIAMEDLSVLFEPLDQIKCAEPASRRRRRRRHGIAWRGAPWLGLTSLKSPPRVEWPSLANGEVISVIAWGRLAVCVASGMVLGRVGPASRLASRAMAMCDVTSCL